MKKLLWLAAKTNPVQILHVCFTQLRQEKLCGPWGDQEALKSPIEEEADHLQDDKGTEQTTSLLVLEEQTQI